VGDVKLDKHGSKQSGQGRASNRGRPITRGEAKVRVSGSARVQATLAQGRTITRAPDVEGAQRNVNTSDDSCFSGRYCGRAHEQGRQHQEATSNHLGVAYSEASTILGSGARLRISSRPSVQCSRRATGKSEVPAVAQTSATRESDMILAADATMIEPETGREVLRVERAPECIPKRTAQGSWNREDVKNFFYAR